MPACVIVIVLRPFRPKTIDRSRLGVSRGRVGAASTAEVGPVRYYADAPARRVRQVAGDLLAVAWVALWVRIALEVRERVDVLAGPGRQLEAAGTQLTESLREAGEQVDDVPLVGEALQGPLDAVGDVGRALARAGVAQREAVADLGLFLLLVLIILPVTLVLVTWLPRRARWARQASAAARLATAPEGSRLLALRALTGLDLPTLSRAAREPVFASSGGDPALAWARGEPTAVRRLAALELDRLGLRHPPTSPS
jgi:hypothetical protein